MIWIGIGVISFVVVVVLYSCLVVGSRADDTVEQWYEEHKVKDE